MFVPFAEQPLAPDLEPRWFELFGKRRQRCAERPEVNRPDHRANADSRKQANPRR